MKAKEKFKIGQRVRPTKLWIDRGATFVDRSGEKRYTAKTRATVVGFPRPPLSVTLLCDGRKTRESYHMDFWKQVKK